MPPHGTATGSAWHASGACSAVTTAVCAARSALGAVRGLVKRRTMNLGLRFYASAGFNNQVMITYFSNVYVIITYYYYYVHIYFHASNVHLQRVIWECADSRGRAFPVNEGFAALKKLSPRIIIESDLSLARALLFIICIPC